MKKSGIIAVIVISFATGFLFGAAAIHRPIPNAPKERPPDRKVWKPKDFLGLIGSIGIRTLAGHLKEVPLVVMETKRVIVLKLPTERKNRVHYILVPKVDIRDIGSFSARDAPYLTDIFLTARKLVKQEHLHNYYLNTNGPGLQTVGYLHFHLVGRKKAAR